MTTEKLWRIKAGQREQRTFTVVDDATLVDVTGWQVDARIRSRPGGPVVYTFPAEHVTTDGAAVTLTIPAPTSAVWTWPSGWYRCVLTAPAGDPDDPQRSRVLEGVFVIDPD